MKRPSTYSLLLPIWNAINCTFYCNSITDNAGFNYTIHTCSTLWASIGFTVTIAGQTYTIMSFVPDQSITVQGTVALSLTTASFQLYAPKFYHGTIKATDTDLNTKVNANLLLTDKLPMGWLHEPTDETIDEDMMKAIGMRSKCELYFMIDYSSKSIPWTNDQHYEFAVWPMRNLIDAFMESVSRAKTLNSNLIKKSSPVDLPRFGSYTGKSNSDTTVFSQPMSGTRFNIELPWIRHDLLCCQPNLTRI